MASRGCSWDLFAIIITAPRLSKGQAVAILEAHIHAIFCGVKIISRNMSGGYLKGKGTELGAV
jgi:hypothetical protein